MNFPIFRTKKLYRRKWYIKDERSVMRGYKNKRSDKKIRRCHVRKRDEIISLKTKLFFFLFFFFESKGSFKRTFNPLITFPPRMKALWKRDDPVELDRSGKKKEIEFFVKMTAVYRMERLKRFARWEAKEIADYHDRSWCSAGDRARCS